MIDNMARRSIKMAEEIREEVIKVGSPASTKTPGNTATSTKARAGVTLEVLATQTMAPTEKVEGMSRKGTEQMVIQTMTKMIETSTKTLNQ